MSPSESIIMGARRSRFESYRCHVAVIDHMMRMEDEAPKSAVELAMARFKKQDADEGVAIAS